MSGGDICRIRKVGQLSSRLDRRDFLLAMLATGGAFASGSFERSWGMQSSPSVTAQQVRRVLVMFKCHFDAGFVDTQEHVVQKYFQKYFPRLTSASRVGIELLADGITAKFFKPALEYVASISVAAT